MQNKGLMIAIVVVIGAVAGFLLFSSKNDSAQLAQEQKTSSQEPTGSTSDASEPTSILPATAPTPPAKNSSDEEEQGQFSGEGEINSPDIAVFEVNYDGTSFSPKLTTINMGDIVIFKNNSGKDFWPASDNHPEHTIYPEFDPKKSIANGGKFEFKFLKKGTWGFHDHKNSSAKGTITVK